MRAHKKPDNISSISSSDEDYLPPSTVQSSADNSNKKSKKVNVGVLASDGDCAKSSADDGDCASESDIFDRIQFDANFITQSEDFKITDEEIIQKGYVMSVFEASKDKLTYKVRCNNENSIDEYIIHAYYDTGNYFIIKRIGNNFADFKTSIDDFLSQLKSKPVKTESTYSTITNSQTTFKPVESTKEKVQSEHKEKDENKKSPHPKS